jgi:DNA recombination protein RmuC
MDTMFLTILAAVAAPFFGALLSWLVIRGRIDDAFQKGQASSSSDLAIANERVKASELQRSELNAEIARLQTRASEANVTLAQTKMELSKYEERVQRLSSLEIENQRLNDLISEATKKEIDLTSKTERLSSAFEAESNATAESRNQIKILDEKNVLLSAQVNELISQNSMLAEKLNAEQKSAEEKLKLLAEARASLSDQFKSLANDILEEKSKRFTEQNQSNIGQLLDPLKEKITAFQAKVEEVYVKEGTDRATLAGQVQELVKLNKSLSDDAKNLSSALKGSSKAQGNWGELMLERVLEASGLRRGHEYDAQESHSREDGTRAQPDVVIHLPNDRHLVVDSKVSLTAYEIYSSSDDEDERQNALKNHLLSIRNHIKGLSSKKYEDLHGEKSLDCVLMFVPIEPAFMAAITNDNNLFMEAWEKNVLLVSPSTLLFVVRTVAHLWRTEAQNRNAQDIAKRGAELYDKLVGFVEDLEKVGERLKQAQSEYDKSRMKLTGGRGNLIRQAEMLIDLGVKPSKALPPRLIETAISEDARSSAAPVE